MGVLIHNLNNNYDMNLMRPTNIDLLGLLVYKCNNTAVYYITFQLNMSSFTYLLVLCHNNDFNCINTQIDIVVFLLPIDSWIPELSTAAQGIPSYVSFVG